MDTALNYRGITRYSYSAAKPVGLIRFFRRVAGLLRAALAVNREEPYGLSNAMGARMYL